MSSILKVSHLSKRFNGFLAVDDVSFEANVGEIFGLLGPNGAGKTTTLRTIATVLAPTSGTAQIAGFDIVQQPEEVKKRIGVLTTEIGVYERFSGRENLRYFGELYGLSGGKLEDRISGLAKLLEMEPFIDRRAGKYSTGMKQKLAIARSVIHDPEIIIFDEPTAGLDVLASQTVIKFMQQAKQQGKLVILSTHEMTDAEKLCDRVAIIHQGKLQTIDTVTNLLQKTGARDLEEAFIKLVPDKGVVQSDSKTGSPRHPRFSLARQTLVLRIAGLAFILLGAAGSALDWFLSAIGYACLFIGVIIIFFARSRFRKGSTE